jgi:hypothetical protein
MSGSGVVNYPKHICRARCGRSERRVTEARLLGSLQARLRGPEAWKLALVVDLDDVIGRVYGLRAEGVALIRPDGYLGLVDRVPLAENLRGPTDGHGGPR